MKKMIIALMCVVHGTCFTMDKPNNDKKVNEANNRKGFRDIPQLLHVLAESQALSVESQTLSGVAIWRLVELQERQTIAEERQANAIEVIANVSRLNACIITEEYTYRKYPAKYKALNCQDMYKNYVTFEKNGDQS